jgi:hypothetical protein
MSNKGEWIFLCVAGLIAVALFVLTFGAKP